MTQVLKDKDGSIRWDYHVRLETWEGDEYVLTFGGKPIGPTVDYRTGQAIRDWLIHAPGACTNATHCCIAENRLDL